MLAEFESVRLSLAAVKAYFDQNSMKHELHGFTPTSLYRLERTLFDVERHQIRCCNSLNFQVICVEVSLKCS